MQHQMNQQEQCGSQPMQQPYMFCPVQYVYETPVILPQAQENQIQQNQIVFNVKNPPPWIHNRPQSQVVYVQQFPNNYQPYINPQMIQNPIYHQQMTYQIPMLTQDNRHYVQISNLSQHNTIQNPTQITNEEADKMPLLTQMLSRKDNPNIPQVVNNVRPNMLPMVNVIRPMQNQQVQTERTNNKGRPQMIPQQILTINPMQHTQMINQKIEGNVRLSNMSEVPQHIMSRVPSSISVKTINSPRSVLKTVAKSTQNTFYYNPILMPSPNTDVKAMPNVDKQQIRLSNNIQDNNLRMTMPMQYPPISNVPPMVRMSAANNTANNNTYKQQANVKATPNANLQNSNANKDLKTEATTVKNTDSQTQTEKLVRNTVFVQARGRVLKDKEPVQNVYLKRTIDDVYKTDSTQTQEKSDKTQDKIENNISEDVSNKKIKIEEKTENTFKITEKNITSSKVANNSPANIQTQQTRINNLQSRTDEEQKNKDLPKTNDTKIVSKNFDEKLKEPKFAKVDKDSSINNNSSIDKEMKESEDIKHLNVVPEKVNTNSMVKDSNLEGTIKKEENITVLTHVVEGFIIQESNVAFPIQTPALEKEPTEENKMKTQNQKDFNQNKMLEMENKTGFNNSWCMKIKKEAEIEFAVEKAADDPFGYVKKSTVESWTAEQLSSHLEKHNWRETATKLLEEEIDGESFLLVNKNQLETIGVTEEHAQIMANFINS